MDKRIKGSIWVLILLLLFFYWLSRKADAAETYLELGPSIVSNQFSDSFTLILQERWAGKYALALGYISEQTIDTCPELLDRPDCRWTVQEQLLVGAERIVSGNFDRWRWLNRISFSVGPYWFQNANRISSCHLNVRLALDLRLTDRWSIKASHFSNAGSCKEMTLVNPNDTRFAKPIPITFRFNVGQDAILITGRF